MRDNQAPRPVRLADYRPPAFLVESAELDFDIRDGGTRVHSRLRLYRNPDRDDAPAHCELDGEALKLESLHVDGVEPDDGDWQYESDKLVLFRVPDRFLLETTVTIVPEENTALEGLYRSDGMYCTQCEAEGFRRITFFPDRPDVLARFTTTVRADRERFPVLLSNGNPVASGEDGGRHWVRWEDPFPKPCYLFALVAGNLDCLEDEYTTGSGRRVTLRIYAESRDLDKLHHAMDSLKRAMAWDEETFGREYDLDLYMIVAVSHFNMGAMENKGLNIFNTSCVLAHHATTTDAAFQRVESVVAHEYFHNWSGNRVTCRDWFQLSLKEGFTVFRDSEFSADMNSRSVKRIQDVDFLRTVQFPEDQGPMAHPVRPDEYVKIDNFYTMTVYEKGAEVVRMLRNLLGAQGFRHGTDLYFSRFDGQAVTCDDFVDCMEEVSGLDLSQFRRWYSQAGTPRLTVSDEWHDGEYRLRIRQHTPPTPGQRDKQPLMVPVRMGLLGENGDPLPVDADGAEEMVLILREEEETFSFPATERPVPSLLRGFSAPVELEFPYTEDQLRFVLSHDVDGFCRWDAAQRLYHGALGRMLDGADVATEARVLAPALDEVLNRADEDRAETALLLAVPSETAIGDRYSGAIRPAAIHQARDALLYELVVPLRSRLESMVRELDGKAPWNASAEDMARRSLQQRLLAMLAAAGGDDIATDLRRRFRSADNMTEELGALRLLVVHGMDGADEALQRFHERWHDEALVLDQWFALQAAVPSPHTAARVRELVEHPDFDWKLPNRVRAVMGTFATGNPVAFHAASGDGYALFAEVLERLDRLNPQIAARMATAASRLPRLEPTQAGLLRGRLQELRAGDCSGNLREMLDRLLAA